MRAAAARLLLADAEAAGACWTPRPGPQAAAYGAEADVVGFGGPAEGWSKERAVDWMKQAGTAADYRGL